MHKLDDVLQHWGIKGMKWGVVRKRPEGADNETGEKIKRGKIGQRLDSLKRERQWRKILNDVDKLSTTDISNVTRRISLENDLKILSKSKIGTAKDRQDYLRRANMDNNELSRKVVRLRAKEKLYKTVNDASKEQREFGIKVVQIGSVLGYKYAVNRTLRPKDIFDAVNDPKTEANTAKKDIQKLVLEKLKKASNKP